LAVLRINEQRADAHFANFGWLSGAPAPMTLPNVICNHAGESEEFMSNTKFKPIKINFTEDEYQTIKDYAKSCSITVTAFFRALLDGYHPKPLMDEQQQIFLERLYMRHSISHDAPTKVLIEKIILDFEQFCRLPERGDQFGGYKPVGN